MTEGASEKEDTETNLSYFIILTQAREEAPSKRIRVEHMDNSLKKKKISPVIMVHKISITPNIAKMGVVENPELGR